MLAMVCLQIANSDVYDMLVAEPTFVTSWNDDFAYKLTQKKEENDKSWEQNFKQARESDDFDEDSFMPLQGYGTFSLSMNVDID